MLLVLHPQATCAGLVRRHNCLCFACCSHFAAQILTTSLFGFVHAVLQLQAKQQNGQDYKRTALLDMVRGVIRVINTSYKHSELEGKPAPIPISLSKDVKLSPRPIQPAAS